MNSIYLLSFLAAFSFVYPQGSFAETYRDCLEIYCQQDQSCFNEAQPLLLNALNKYSLSNTTSSFEDFFNWYNDFYMELSVSNTTKSFIAQDASIFCFVSYNWYQDQINTKYTQSTLPQPSYKFLLINKLDKNVIPITQFSYQFADCIQNFCEFDDQFFSDLLNSFISTLASSQNQKSLEDWYQVFKDITNNIAIQYCFISYDWKQDFINKKQILKATNITEYQNNQNNNNSNSNSNNNNTINCQNNTSCPPNSQNGNGLVTPPSSYAGMLKNIYFYILIISFTL